MQSVEYYLEFDFLLLSSGRDKEVSVLLIFFVSAQLFSHATGIAVADPPNKFFVKVHTFWLSFGVEADETGGNFKG